MEMWESIWRPEPGAVLTADDLPEAFMDSIVDICKANDLDPGYNSFLALNTWVAGHDALALAPAITHVIYAQGGSRPVDRFALTQALVELRKGF